MERSSNERERESNSSERNNNADFNSHQQSSIAASRPKGRENDITRLESQRNRFESDFKQFLNIYGLCNCTAGNKHTNCVISPFFTVHNQEQNVQYPLEHAVVNHDGNDIFSEVTSVSKMGSIRKETIDQFTQKMVWPKIKFFLKLDMDPDLAWSDESGSVCQITLEMNHLKSKNGDIRADKQAWLTARRMIHNKIRIMRNDRIAAIQKAFYGKFLVFYFFSIFLIFFRIC
jgi:hypothetical protein